MDNKINLDEIQNGYPVNHSELNDLIAAITEQWEATNPDIPRPEASMYKSGICDGIYWCARYINKHGLKQE